MTKFKSTYMTAFDTRVLVNQKKLFRVDYFFAKARLNSQAQFPKW